VACNQKNTPPVFLFYFHGAVVTEYGDNAINQSMPEWGPYEYSNILDSLRIRGFVVMSEIRKKGVNNDYYVTKTVWQIDSLLDKGIKPENITVLGASAGWDITLKVSASIKNHSIKYVLMGGCWENSHEEYASLNLRGSFLSIIEKSDPHGSCKKLHDAHPEMDSFNEVILNTGLSHGFIYKGLPEWINPLTAWCTSHQ